MEYELSNGLIVTIDYDYIEPPDPDSGIFRPYVNCWWISEVGGRKCSARVSDWLHERIGPLTGADIENAIVEEFW